MYHQMQINPLNNPYQYNNLIYLNKLNYLNYINRINNANLNNINNIRPVKNKLMINTRKKWINWYSRIYKQLLWINYK